MTNQKISNEIINKIFYYENLLLSKKGKIKKQYYKVQIYKGYRLLVNISKFLNT